MIGISTARKLRLLSGTFNSTAFRLASYSNYCSGSDQNEASTSVAIPVQVMNPPPSSSLLPVRRDRRHHLQYNGAVHPHTIPAEVVQNVLITPPPSPTLLLEGDELYISHGKSHTVFRLKYNNGKQQHSDVRLEESYDIERACKQMSLIIGTDSRDYQHANDIFSFHLQEINHGVQNGCGTGSMSWDSSIGKICISHENDSFFFAKNIQQVSYRVYFCMESHGAILCTSPK